MTNEMNEKSEAEIVETEATEPEINSNFKWYIARSLTNQENSIIRALKERIVNHKLTEFFGEILAPEEEVTTHVNGKKRTLKKKLFPGYLLVHMQMTESTWHLVKNTNKITGFIGGTSDRPAPLSDEEAAYMTGKGKGATKKSAKASIDISEGEQVKVTEGPFATFVGTVEAVSEKGKLKVNVSIFGRPTPVELDYSQVEKIS